MGAQTALSVEEYLRTSFPAVEPEYRDGELVERAFPDYPHGQAQALLSAFFVGLRRTHVLYPCSETRVRLSDRRVLIPDIAVFHLNRPPRVPDTPPLVVIEILSPDDRLSEVRDKLEEYRAWGVPHVWLVDPGSRRIYTFDAGLKEVSLLEIPELGIQLGPADAFE